MMRGEDELTSVRYSISDSPRFSEDPTAFVEDEDFDFGLFIANLTSSARRRRIALDN